MLKKILSAFGFIVVLIFGAIGGEIGKHIGNAVSLSPKLTPQQIEAKLIDGITTAVQQINQQAPTMVDNDTRMDGASAGPGAHLTYHYTFPNYTSRDIDHNWLLTNLQPKVKKDVCANEKMKPSLQYGVTYVYSYAGNDKVEIARFEVNRNDCGLASVSQ